MSHPAFHGPSFQFLGPRQPQVQGYGLRRQIDSELAKIAADVGAIRHRFHSSDEVAPAWRRCASA